MFEPIRGGTRGGQAEFKWADVSADKDRENYLGHSINAPTGRWQKNKDIHWYNRDIDSGAAARAEEIRKIKELEAEALSAALGYEPASKTKTLPSGATSSGANAVPVASSSAPENRYATVTADPISNPDKDIDKEARRRKKEEKKEEKRARKELKKLSKTGAHGVADLPREQAPRHPSRSRSPRFRSTERRAEGARRPRSRSRSRTPPLERRSSGAHQARDYDAEEREKERERDRRRWDRSRRERDGPQDRLRY